jgi:hypothetical protein
MNWLLLTLLVLSPAFLYLRALAAMAIAGKYYRRPCPTCRRRGLKRIQFVKATIEIDGTRVPGSWSYYVCDKCGEALKLHRGEWTSVPISERHHIDRSVY